VRDKIFFCRGVATIYFLLLTLVLFGFMVMAVDFGRLYLIQGELQTAADAAALAAATRLVGAAQIAAQAGDQVTASFDSASGNDNRFNLRQNPICQTCASSLVTTTDVSYFSTLTDAITNVFGAPGSGADSRYVRVQITTQAPIVFVPLLTRDFGTLPTVTTAAVAGLSSPMCTASGIDGLAVVAVDADPDPANVNYGFVPGSFYTLSRTAQAALPGTESTVLPYVILDHFPAGIPGLDLDASLFELGAGGISNSAGLTPPGNITVNAVETAYPNGVALEGMTGTAGQDILCGLNVRFGVNPSANTCINIAGGEFVEVLTDAPALNRADTDLGDGAADSTGLQDYATEYHGNLRRILTMAVVDAAGTLSVLNFRQFLLEPVDAATQGLNPSLATGAFRAQYIGAPVPLRSGAIGGLCNVSSGVGRIVLH
jgi:Flp pilus assembly protein TadG